MKKNGFFKDLTGYKFGDLVVISRDYNAQLERNSKKAYWLCNCSCGGNRVIMSHYLLSKKKPVTCCIKCAYINSANSMKTHGMKKTSIYRSWCGMKNRCYNTNSDSYPHYGARGITVCDRWRNSFENFYEDMGDRPKGMSLDRIDVNGNYEPSNCKWSTVGEQNNNKTNSIRLTCNGLTMSVTDWAKFIEVDRVKLQNRLYRNWSHDKIIMTPFK